MQVVVGLIMIALGFSMVYYANWTYNNLGAVAFFEKYLGAGGTRLGYKLIGMLILFLGALSTFDLIDVFLFWVFAPVIKLMMPSA